MHVAISAQPSCLWSCLLEVTFPSRVPCLPALTWGGGVDLFFPPSRGWELAWAVQKGRDKSRQSDLHGPRANMEPYPEHRQSGGKCLRVQKRCFQVSTGEG